MQGSSWRVPAEYSAAADTEVVIKFECAEVGELQAAKKLADLPKEKPSLDKLLKKAQEQFTSCNDDAGARRLCGQADKLYPNEPRVMRAQAWLLLMAKDEKLRDPKRALELAREAVKKTEEKNGQMLDTLAVALHDTGDLAEAARYAKLAAEKSPGNKAIANRAAEYAKESEQKK